MQPASVASNAAVAAVATIIVAAEPEEQPKQPVPQPLLAHEPPKAEGEEVAKKRKNDDALAGAAERVKDKGKAPAIDGSRRDTNAPLNAIIAGQRESSARLSDEQEARLAEARVHCSKELETCNSRQMTSMRGSKYLGSDSAGNPQVLLEGRLNLVGHDKYQVCLSDPPRKIAVGDRVLVFRDVGIKYEDGSVTTEIVCDDVIIEPLDSVALGKIEEFKGVFDRQTGADYCRLGFPVQDFTKILDSMATVRPSMKGTLQVAAWHYWAVSSWGVSGCDTGDFLWRKGDSAMSSSNQPFIHSSIFKGRSLRGTATIAISIHSPLLIKDNIEDEDLNHSRFGFQLLRFTLRDVADAPWRVQTQIAGSVVEQQG
eukprot:SM000158S02006  [mRNA]  locus=s158:16747:17856:+ [translate_table: standard]